MMSIRIISKLGKQPKDWILFANKCYSTSTKKVKKLSASNTNVNLNESKEKIIQRKNEDQTSSSNTEQVYFNPCNIQMISDELYEQVFIDVNREKTFNDELIAKCKNHLEKHGLWQEKLDIAKPVQFVLPEIEGLNIDEHFKNIALQQTFKYKKLLNQLLETVLPDVPTQWNFQCGWTKYFKDGTHKQVPFPEEDAYVFDVEVCMSNGQVPTLACAVSHEAWYSWCSESLINGVNRDLNAKVTLKDLIPFETCSDKLSPPTGNWAEKIIVGHNVSYDRTRIREQYFLEKTKMRFIDTMSLHIAVSGITSFQRALKMTIKSRSKPGNPKGEIGDVAGEFDWNELSSLNNLADVHKLYCNGPAVKKDERNIFVKGTLENVREDFQNLVSYCARDVTATFEILQKLLPTFYERFPHPVTLCGMLEMGTTYLPINKNWDRYIEKSDKVFDDMEKEVKSVLVQKASEAVNFLDGEKYKEDPWLWDLDWKVTKKRVSKKALAANSGIIDNEIQYPAWYKKLLYKPGEADYEPGPSKISSSMKVVPKILRLTWYGFPLHHSKSGGWGFLVKKLNSSKPIIKDFQIFDDSQDECISANGENSANEDSNFPYKQWEIIWEASKRNLKLKLSAVSLGSSTQLNTVQNEIINKSEDAAQELSDFIKGLEIISSVGKKSKRVFKFPEMSHASKSPHPQCDFIPLPHKNGANYNVGNPLAKDFLSKIEEGILSCQEGQDIANKVVRISKMVSYWRNNRDRILGQMTVWLNNVKDSNDKLSNDEYGAILPQVVVSGTLTRRAVEPTWMTASNAYVDRIGSELKSMIQAPPSYHFVGADVDSQELWIASVIGDAHFAGQHGCTALGWMTLQGSKSAGTDMHSKTAALIGIGRDQSKVVNYARIYGAGVSFAETLLMQFNRSMSSSEAKKKAITMYKMTKGVRKYLLNEEGKQLAKEMDSFHNRTTEALSKSEIQQIMNYHQFPFSEYLSLVDKLVWDDGTESYMFNRLEEIAQDDCPKTPVLSGCISRSLVPSVVQNDYMTSRVNWVVQSSAVDYLHLMLTCMGWLIKKYNINARFSLSVHDEVRYLVSSEDRYRLALALQITNLLTRSFCCYRLGMYDIPQSVAFFSCVDIDKALRKEVTDDCITPSNPDGLNLGYGIPPGEALNIWDILKLTDGSLLKKTKVEK